MNYVLSPAAVRKLRRAIAANPGNTGAGAAPSPVSVDDYPPPFTVRWSSSETSGGTWLIWLPDRSKLVVYDGTYINTISGVTAAQNFSSGYYTVNALQASSTNVYLNVTVTESTGAATAALADSPASASSGEKVYSILVATMATDQTKGTKSVKQFVDSAIIIGGEGGESVVPDDKSTEYIPDPPAGTPPDGDEGKLQIKGWKTGTPASTTSLATDINWEYTTEALVARDLTDGTLRYKPIGDLATLLGSQVSKANQKLLTGLSWNTTNHTLVISSATVTIDHGVITSWTNNNDETISTTSINSIIN